jgi:hypothetical protein
MSTAWVGEYVLDAETLSATDLVVTLPTRHHYVTAAGASTPFQGPSAWSPTCLRADSSVMGDPVFRFSFDRETRGTTNRCDFGFPVPCPENNAGICAATGVASLVTRDRSPSERTSSTVFGSTTQGLARGDWRFIANPVGGWTALGAQSANATSVGLGSLPDSVRVNLDTGQVVTGRHTFFGLPVVGFFARTFNNGQLSCAGTTCQGIYGSAFPTRHFQVVLP